MPFPPSHRIRVHGVRAAVVALLLAALVSPAWRAGAQARPVDPVPVGVWPLQPRPEVVRAFDPPTDPFGAGHRGVDLAGRVGDRVRAALAGRVRFVGRVAGRGVVVLDHGSTRTTYQPVTALVRVGERVGLGQAIGLLDLAGSHCLPAACLHWGWIRGETYLDPLLLVGGGPIRLLPLWRGPPAVPVPIPVPRLPFAPVTTALGWAPSGSDPALARSRKVPPPVVTAPRPPPAVSVRSMAIRPLLL